MILGEVLVTLDQNDKSPILRGGLVTDYPGMSGTCHEWRVECGRVR